MQLTRLGDAINFDFGKTLTVTVLHAVALAALLLENDYLVAFLMAQHRSVDLGVQNRRAYGYVAFLFDQEDLIETEAIAFRGF